MALEPPPVRYGARSGDEPILGVFVSLREGMWPTYCIVHAVPPLIALCGEATRSRIYPNGVPAADENGKFNGWSPKRSLKCLATELIGHSLLPEDHPGWAVFGPSPNQYVLNMAFHMRDTIDSNLVQVALNAQHKRNAPLSTWCAYCVCVQPECN